jgi:hypothetical protein
MDFNTQRTLTNIEKTQYDPETGCRSGNEVAFESCRQTYFLKQQNQILQSQQSKQNTQPVIQAVINEAVATSTSPKIGINGNGNGNVSLILIIVVLVVVIINKFLPKDED